METEEVKLNRFTSKGDNFGTEIQFFRVNIHDSLIFPISIIKYRAIYITRIPYKNSHNLNIITGSYLISKVVKF